MKGSITSCLRLFGALSTTVMAVGSKRNLADVNVMDCNKNLATIDLLLLEGDANHIAMEDEIRNDLAKIGLTVESRFLPRNDFDKAVAQGSYGMSFSETWGSPYDPHSYVSAWESEENESYNAMINLTAPATRSELLTLIEDVLQEDNMATRVEKWNTVHNYYHSQAVFLPMWGRRIVAIINSRLSGYTPGFQQFDFPVQKLMPVTGSDTVTISPGALTGKFETVGNMDPHTYNPNEFFSNNWIYEGLVSYGEGGAILPSLAVAWSEGDTSDGGSKYTFQLRQNVTFHDGAAWNCAAAKLNLDHVFAGALRTPDWHGWFGVPKYIKDWECTDEFELVMRTTTTFYPFLQELTFIRPIRFLSPNAFKEGNTSDPFTANSCEVGWGTLTTKDNLTTPVTCAGISYISGTGPFEFKSRNTSVVARTHYTEQPVDNEVVFVANENYWDGPPAIKTLKVIRYETSNEIKAAILDGSLDVIWGDGVLPAEDITDIRNLDQSNLEVFFGEDIQNVVLVMNTGTPPLNNINIRKSVIHAIDKNAMIQKELGGFLEAVDNVFPRAMPYCDVDLTPSWSYDLEKAILLSCEGFSTTDGGATDSTSNKTSEGGSGEVSSSTANSVDDEDDNSKTVALGLGLGLGIPLLIVFAFAMVLLYRNHELIAQVEEAAQKKNMKTLDVDGDPVAA